MFYNGVVFWFVVSDEIPTGFKQDRQRCIPIFHTNDNFMDMEGSSCAVYCR